MAVCSKCEGRKNIILSAEQTGLGIGAEVTCDQCQGTGETGIPGACKTCNDSKTSILPASRSPLGIAMEIDCPDCTAATAA